MSTLSTANFIRFYTPLAEKFLLHNGSVIRIGGAALSRKYFSTRIDTFVPVKVPAIEKMSPAARASMNADLDGVCVLPHFHPQDSNLKPSNGGQSDWKLPHPVWSKKDLEESPAVHFKPENLLDRAAYISVRALCKVFDLLTGYSLGFQNEDCMLRRVIILEAVAGVPGIVGAMNRHLRSLRKMDADRGWIHTLLEEAENGRMHLMIAMCLRQPSFLTRLSVICVHGIFFPFYSVAYAFSPKFCHRFVGYLEEQAVHTYTNIINKIDEGELPGFKVPAPAAVRNYYQLAADATMREVFMAIRADENHHREVNHTFAIMDRNEQNPFPPGF